MKPTVSIILPNLNYREFLEERVESIRAQTLSDWELIIVDSYSTDGAWELLQEITQGDDRVSLSQAPRGLYQSWNRCLEQVSGEFVYIATSDDTMAPEALQKMVEALRQQPQCDICDTKLKITDYEGHEFTEAYQRLPIHRYLGEYAEVDHLRARPHDALFHTTGRTVYTSMTQILFRKALLDRVGLFRTDWGTRCDYEWAMRCSLTTNTVYLAEQLCTWRRHDQQVTGSSAITNQHVGNLEMAQAALDAIRQLNPAFTELIDEHHFLSFLEERSQRDLIRQGDAWQRLGKTLAFILRSPTGAARLFAERLPSSISNYDGVSQHIERLDRRVGLRSMIQPMSK
ncbi:MAG: glycosyltransferase [Planctomycetota bacterium]